MYLKIEFGSGRVSFENLFKASGRKESKGLILSQAFEIVGLPVQKSPLLSERICRPCGRKIRNVHENYEGNSDHDTDAQVQRVTDDEVHNLAYRYPGAPT